MLHLQLQQKDRLQQNQQNRNFDLGDDFWAKIISLAKVVFHEKGIYTTHMRSEGDYLIESVEEVLNIGEKSGVPVHISHLKTSDEKNWDKLKGVLAMQIGKLPNSHKKMKIPS